MGWYAPTTTEAFYRQLPKVDLHRHLEGSLRVSTLQEIARDEGITLPVSAGDLAATVQIQPSDALNSTVFLSKFQTLRLFYRTPEIIARVTREAIADAHADGVRYLELRFTPLALGRVRGFSLAEVMDWVCDSAMQASREFGLPTCLIASVNRHESVAVAEQVAGLAVERMGRGIVALDLAGNEADFDALPFLGVFRAAQAAGLRATVHAGEWGGAENVRQAIEAFQVDRIGHGVRVMEDAAVIALARERQTAFEVCPTSNYQSGVTRSVREHPFRGMLAQGLNVTACTDDPGISQITLSDEYRVLVEEAGLTRERLVDRILAAARASFLPAPQRETLLSKLPEEITATMASL